MESASQKAVAVQHSKVEHAPDCPNPVTIEKLVRIPRRYQDPKDPDTPQHIIVHFCPNCGAGVVLGFAV
jgi:hypothetical protein